MAFESSRVHRSPGRSGRSEVNRGRPRGAIQLKRLPGPVAEPVKVAQAYSSPTDCQTLAAVLQIDLICTDATIAAPKNATVAVNTACDRCDTVPLALHYVISADDPTRVPVCINQLVAAVNQELAAQQGDPALSLPDAEARVDGVIV